jgi:ankyrin repeat protein
VEYLLLLLLLAGPEIPLFEAVRAGDMAVLKTLLKTVNPNARGSRNQTALHEAAAACNPEAARILIAAGADRRIQDDAKRTAAMIASGCPQSASKAQFLKLLHPLPVKPVNESARWSLHDAAARGDAAVLAMLLKLGADVNGAGTNGNRALEIASRKGNPAVVRMLLDHGADPHLKTAAGTGVLHEAALGGDPETIDLLVAAGVDVHETDDESASTPLHYAASFGRAEAVKALLRHGADRTRKNRNGMTPADVARANDQNDVLALFQ